MNDATNTTSHIVTRFDDELSHIEAMTFEMAKLAGKHLGRAMQALAKHDTKLAKKLIKRDAKVNDLQLRIDTAVVQLIATRQPMASDLRQVIAPLRITADIERIGDHAKTMARRVSSVEDIRDIGSARSTLKRMSKMVRKQLKLVMQAYEERDIALAAQIHNADQEIDEMFNALVREMLTYMMSNPANIEPALHLVFIGRNLERCGDHAQNIAEQVHYLVTGEMLEELEILPLDDDEDDDEDDEDDGDLDGLDDAVNTDVERSS